MKRKKTANCSLSSLRVCVLVSFWIRRRNADCFCVIAAFPVATGELYDLKALF